MAERLARLEAEAMAMADIAHGEATDQELPEWPVANEINKVPAALKKQIKGGPK